MKKKKSFDIRDLAIKELITRDMAEKRKSAIIQENKTLITP